MGGFSPQVQQPQASQPSGGKGIGSAVDQINLSESSPNTSTPQPLGGVQSGYFPQSPKPMGKGGVQTNSATSGQPRAGMPNQYSNTVGQWDNTQIQPQQSHGGGKGKG
jgi:hypothetical protein